MRILVLGGTAEARALAKALDDAALPFISSLAGRVANPRLPVGEVRIGGFGGVDGLAAYVAAEQISVIVDATHPFAVTMSAHAVAAGARCGVPVIRYARPGWASRPDAASWHWVESLDGARLAAEQLGQRPFISSGRQTLPAFSSWTDRDVLVRVVEPLDDAPPPRWRVVLDRGPYTLDGELALMREHRADVLITKDSGGSYTSAKLDAAAQLGVPVVVWRRPAVLDGAREVTSMEECLAALL